MSLLKDLLSIITYVLCYILIMGLWSHTFDGLLSKILGFTFITIGWVTFGFLLFTEADE